MKEKQSFLALNIVAGIGLVLIASATLLEVQVAAAQQQMAPAEDHHENGNSNQSGISSTLEQRQNRTRAGGGMMVINQTSNINWVSLVNDVKVTGISIIDNEHIAINLLYDGEGEPPGVSVVAMTSSSSDRIIDSVMMMQNSTTTSDSNTSSVPILSMQSGSNYLEAGWQVQHPNSATVLVQLDGEIPGRGHIMVIVFPFLHR